MRWCPSDRPPVRALFDVHAVEEPATNQKEDVGFDDGDLESAASPTLPLRD